MSGSQEENGFLVITRKPGESISIGNAIEVEVSEVSGKQVKVAIKAPKEVPIQRKELKEKQDAAKKKYDDARKNEKEELRRRRLRNLIKLSD